MALKMFSWGNVTVINVQLCAFLIFHSHIRLVFVHTVRLHSVLVKTLIPADRYNISTLILNSLIQFSNCFFGMRWWPFSLV